MKIKNIKKQLEIIIFGTDTKAGKLFDITLLVVIIVSVLGVIIESIPGKQPLDFLSTKKLEWFFTAIFGFDYLLRIWVSSNRKKYVFSFWGIIDFIAFIPSLLMIFLSGVHYIGVIRGLRLLRVFRILKLTRYMSESIALIEALKNSTKKIIVFLMFVLIIAIIMGTFMYVVEGGHNLKGSSFRSIPDSIYWAIVTITTVGYGDITPQTFLGKFISSVLMLIGYGVIAIPTGIVTAEIVTTTEGKKCVSCNSKIKLNDNFCSSYGSKIQK